MIKHKYQRCLRSLSAFSVVTGITNCLQGYLNHHNSIAQENWPDTLKCWIHLTLLSCKKGRFDISDLYKIQQNM